MSVSQKKSWNPGTQKMDYILYNEKHISPQDSVRNATATDQKNWIAPEDQGHFKTALNGRADFYTIAEICPDGGWVEFRRNSTKEKRIIAASEFMKWTRSMWYTS